MIHMRAVVAFDRNGKHLKVGDTFHAYPLEAASLRYNKKAVFDQQGPRPSPASPTYGTRSMTAATPGTVPPPEPPQKESSAVPSQTSEAESTQTTDGGRRRSGRGSQQYGNRAMQRTTNTEE
jgi:hypothetical protein